MGLGLQPTVGRTDSESQDPDVSDLPTRLPDQVDSGHLPLTVMLFISLLVAQGIPMLSFGYWASQRRSDEAVRQFDALAGQRTTDTRDSLLQVVELREEVLAVIAGTAREIPTWDQATLQPILESQLEASASFDGVFIAGIDGVSIAFAPSVMPDGRPTRVGVDYADRRYFKDLIATQQTAFAPLYMGRQSKVPLIPIAVPVFHKSTRGNRPALRGFVSGGIRTALLHEVARRSIGADATRRVLVVDDGGRVVVDTSGQHAPLTDLSEYAASLGACVQDGVDLLDENGRPLRASCAPMTLGAQNWSIWVSAPRQIIEAEATRARISSAAASKLMPPPSPGLIQAQQQRRCDPP